MGFITVDEMRALEANSDYFGVSYSELMENAGKKISDEIIKRYNRCAVLVVCGLGNNGGDGFVAARYLSRAGYRVFVVLLGRASDVRQGPAAINLERLKAIGVEVKEVLAADKLSKEVFDSCDVIVDAIMGTGARGVLREPVKTAIEYIDHSHAQKVSIDIPSGLDPITGKCDICVNADVVITFHALKYGLEKFNNVVVDIGIPEKAMKYIGPGDLLNIKTRGDFTHKGESGRVLVIGGGPYTGAPALTAMAALRAGADVVTVAAPERAAGIIASYSPNLIVKPLSDREILVKDDIGLLKPLISRNDVVVIGMGLGDSPRTQEAIPGILTLCDNVVIDADALRPEMPLKGIITPHRAEFKRISGIEAGHEIGPASETIRKFSAGSKIVTVLKGDIDIISDGSKLKLNSTGNKGMTVGGTGDVLAGIIGALYSKNNAFDAACSGAFVSGLAGDIAFDDKGFGLIATDVIEKIPYAMKKYRVKQKK